MLLQATSLVGALLILLAYAAHQAGRMSRETPVYHVTNALGGGLLLVVALEARQAGFIVLEGVWTLISLAALFRARRPTV
ncbi:MAG TPA: hypothetical protein VJV75_10960 [Candidatus Polarisedimenticolia bacterium]|nr:hypothetical protein [Candidatus Polarisedimenticolia bacterium]